jgi:hypothetical protein
MLPNLISIIMYSNYVVCFIWDVQEFSSTVKNMNPKIRPIDIKHFKTHMINI